MTINTAVVSQVVPVGFADLAQAADQLTGQEIAVDRARLKVQGPVGTGLVGAVRFGGTLRTSAGLLPSVKVEVVVSPWSAHRSEVAIHPITKLGQLESLRATRFFQAARSILPEIADRLTAGIPVGAAVAVELAA